MIENMSEKIKKVYKSKSVEIKKNALKILLINISTHFSKDRDVSEYDVLEPPLGLIALQSYLNREFGENINGKIIKSSVDFDSYEDLNNIVHEFDPDLIGVSSMTFHKNFFHKAIREIRENGYLKMIITGGPHPTTSYEEVLKDQNIDLCVIGEGEATLAEIVKRIMHKDDSKKLDYEDLINIDGIAFSRNKFTQKTLDQKAISS